MSGFLMFALACLPCFPPIPLIISEKFEALRKRKRNNPHKRGSKLLMNMLLARKSALPPVLSVSRRHSWGDGPNPMLDSTAILEVEARNPRAPELDAEAPGPHIVEAETVETILEMYAERPVGELEGQNRYATEIQ